MSRLSERRKARTSGTSRKESSGSNGKAVDTKVITGVSRSTFMRVRSLEENDNGVKLCSTGVLIPKKDKATVEKVKAAIMAAAIKKLGSAGENIFKSRKLHNPLLDGDELADDPESSFDDSARGNYFLNAKAYKLPQVVDKTNSRIDDPDELDEICVSGYYFRFSLTFKGFATEDNSNKGVRVLLNNLMFVKEGERLDGGKTAEQDFEEYAVDSDEEEDSDSDW